MKVLAHRGYSGKYPENTMTAFKKALEIGADGIELDVQLTNDGHVVVIHDETIDRTTDGCGLVRNYTLKELHAFDASAIKPGPWGKERIPTFDEYCSWVKDTDLITNVEIKSGKCYYRGLEAKTLAVVKKYGLEDRIIFSSFNHLSAFLIKTMDPHIACGLLAEHGGIENAGDYCKDFGFKYYHPSQNELTEENIENLKENGIGLNVWTVDTLEKLQWLYEIGADSVITNWPEIPVQWLKTR